MAKNVSLFNLKRSLRSIKGDLDLAEIKSNDILKDPDLVSLHGETSTIKKRIKDALIHIRTALGD